MTVAIVGCWQWQMRAERQDSGCEGMPTVQETRNFFREELGLSLTSAEIRRILAYHTDDRDVERASV